RTVQGPAPMSFRDQTSRPARPAASRQLELEVLEDRTLPAAPLPQAFVASLYQGLLKQDANDYGLAYWAPALRGPQDAAFIASGIVTSDVGRAAQVDALYERILGRHLDPLGQAYFIGGLDHGMTLHAVEATLLGSDEFYWRVGSRQDAYLQAVYQIVLGRD